MPPPITLAIVGADYPNKGKSPPRRFELAICRPGELVNLVPEPENPADEHAIAVFSARGIQLGYLPSERAVLIGKRMRDGCEVVAAFQRHASFGGYIRVAFDGAMPEIPEEHPNRTATEDSGFCPDPIYGDD